MASSNEEENSSLIEAARAAEEEDLQRADDIYAPIVAAAIETARAVYEAELAQHAIFRKCLNHIIYGGLLEK